MVESMYNCITGVVNNHNNYTQNKAKQTENGKRDVLDTGSGQIRNTLMRNQELNSTRHGCNVSTMTLGFSDATSEQSISQKLGSHRLT